MNEMIKILLMFYLIVLFQVTKLKQNTHFLVQQVTVCFYIQKHFDIC